MDEYVLKRDAEEALRTIYEAVWGVDIPSPTVPEYIEHHEQMMKIMKLIREIKDSLPVAKDIIVPTRCRECIHFLDASVYNFDLCCLAGHCIDTDDYCSHAERRAND